MRGRRRRFRIAAVAMAVFGWAMSGWAAFWLTPAVAAGHVPVLAALPATTGPDASTESTESLVIQLVLSLITLILLLVLLLLDLRYIRASRRIAKEMQLPKGQWLRLVKTLPFDPAIEVFAVGVLVVGDVVQNWEHLVAGIAGVLVGAWVGHFRYRIQYVRAVPERKAIVFVRSRTEYVALGLLLVVDFASEQHQIPVVGPLTLLITVGLTLVLAESISRTWFSYRRYRADTSGAAAA